MTSLARLVALILVTNLLVLACGLLAASGHREAALATGAVTLSVFIAGVLRAAGSVPHDRIRTADENARIGWPIVIAGAAILLPGAALFASGAVGGLVAGSIFVVTGATLAILGTGALNAARMLRSVQTVIPADREPRALALAANGMPAQPRGIVVATDDQIVWAGGRRLRERRAIRFADVDRVDIDYKRGRLAVSGAGEELTVEPVPKRELQKFARLLRSEP